MLYYTKVTGRRPCVELFHRLSSRGVRCDKHWRDRFFFIYIKEIFLPSVRIAFPLSWEYYLCFVKWIPCVSACGISAVRVRAVWGSRFSCLGAGSANLGYKSVTSRDLSTACGQYTVSFIAATFIYRYLHYSSVDSLSAVLPFKRALISLPWGELISVECVQSWQQTLPTTITAKTSTTHSNNTTEQHK